MTAVIAVIFFGSNYKKFLVSVFFQRTVIQLLFKEEVNYDIL